MPEQIISASGPQYGMIINPDGSINSSITGSIFIGSVSASIDSIYVQSGDNININKTEVYISGITLGSIISIPSITATVGSQQWVQNFNDLGSSRVIENFPDYYLGSKVWQAEVIEVSGNVTIENSSFIVTLGSTVIDNFNELGSNRLITNFDELGSSRIINNFDELGSSRLITNFNELGSDRVITNFDELGSSRNITNFDELGSSRNVTNFGELGSNRVIDNFNELGSNRVITNFDDLGSSIVVENFGNLGSDRTISNRVAGSIVNIPKTEVYISGPVNDWTINYIQKIDYEDKFQPIYMGVALPGTATDSSGWQIRKNEFSGTSPELVVGILFGSGNVNFDKVWDNRSGTHEAYS